jgi:hypothetical protein
VRPFLLACAARHSSLCALGLAALEQLAAGDELSEAATRELVDALAQARARRAPRAVARRR